MNKEKLGCLILLAIISVTPSCQCRRLQINLSKAILEIPHSVSIMADEASREKLAELIRGTVELDPNYQYDPNNDRGMVLKISIMQPSLTSKTVVLEAILLPPEGSKGESYKAYADIVLKDGGIKGEDIKKAIEATLKDLFHLYRGQKPNNDYYLNKVGEALAKPDAAGSEIIGAIGVLGETKETKAIPMLIKLLQSTEDLALGNACIQALSEIGDGVAMAAIIEFAERKPPIIRRQAIIAARKLATRLAAEWLLVMSLGYEDAVTRKEASEALKEVEAKLAR